MTYEQYWMLDPWLVKWYRDAYQLRVEHENEIAWLQGSYNFHAFMSAIENIHFDKKKHEPVKYLEKPIRITPLSEEEKKQKAEEERKRVIKYFDSLAAKWGHPKLETRQR